MAHEVWSAGIIITASYHEILWKCPRGSLLHRRPLNECAGEGFLNAALSSIFSFSFYNLGHSLYGYFSEESDLFCLVE